MSTHRGKLFALSLLCFLLLLSAVLQTGWTPVVWTIRRVLHHGQTVGIVESDSSGNIKHCSLILVESLDKSEKAHVLAGLSRTYPVEEVDFRTMLSILEACEKLDQAPPNKIGSGTKDESESFNQWAFLQGIVPGTKWCGFNDIANGYHDLGRDFALDKCCRAHDHCPVKVKAFQANFGITNMHPYTKSHCDCDDLFFDCLKQANNEKAKTIGRMFFNVLGLQCATAKYPKVCVLWSSEVSPRPPLPSPDRHMFKWMFSPRNRTARQRDAECLEWAVDQDATPRLEFAEQRRKF